MAASVQQTLGGLPINAPKRRKSYTREFKLEVVKFYREHNLYQMAKQFSLNTKTVGRWVADEDQRKKSRKASKHVTHTRKCQFPDLEESSTTTTRSYEGKCLKSRASGFGLELSSYSSKCTQMLPSNFLILGLMDSKVDIE
jgi:transposase-like protein